MKLEPLALWVKQQSQRLYLLASYIVVYKMMVCFGSRSKQTFKILNKSILEDYKIFALYDRVYTYDFTFYLVYAASYILKQPSTTQLIPTSYIVHTLATC